MIQPLPFFQSCTSSIRNREKETARRTTSEAASRHCQVKHRKQQILSRNVLWLAAQCFQWEYIKWWREHSATTLRNSRKDQATAIPVMQILKEKGVRHSETATRTARGLWWTATTKEEEQPTCWATRRQRKLMNSNHERKRAARLLSCEETKEADDQQPPKRKSKNKSK